MNGANENNIMINEWPPPNPDTRAMFWNSLNDDFCSTLLSDFVPDNENMGLSNQPMLFDDSLNNLSLEQKLFGDSLDDLSLHRKVLDESKSNYVGGFSERMAARKGFSVPKLDTTSLRSKSIASLSDIHTPYLTIPAGLSPTSLLDSPVLLTDSGAQQSPTTGKFPFAENVTSDTISVSVSANPTKREDNLFEDIPEAFCTKLPSTSEKKQEVPSMKVFLQPDNPVHPISIEVGSRNFQNQQQFHLQAGSCIPTNRKETKNNSMLNQRMSDSFVASDHSPAADDRQGGETDLREVSAVVDAPNEDGYNWRKYGQKQVKGSEYPRSYYKCTHPGCPVKKKVERSQKGEITEIIYRCGHNHQKPNPHFRSGPDHTGSQTSFNGKPINGSSQSGNGGQDWLGDGLEATSSAPVAAEHSDPSNSLQWNQDGNHLSHDGIGVSSTMSNDVEGDRDGSISLGCDGEGDETESKTRKFDGCAVEMSASSRAAREPRVVIQFTGDVDILEDGYRWRKYGQKVVKGNQNPRSYYKCTSPGCTVRKHIERASNDNKAVLTTYEGRHNHDVPAARGNSHTNSTPSNGASKTVPQPRNLLQRHEPTQDNFVRFDGRTHLTTFGFAGREPLGATTGFPFTMGRPSSMNPLIAGLGPPMTTMKMPLVPPIHPYLSHHQTTEGFMMPKVELKEQPMSDTALPLPNAASIYQMMSRLPLGPHQM
ncbi:putative WRKY transcription factor 2 isoform X2 [Canna indica]|uniref:WRKY transcription factor 2 isoform X2 n=1 Tax=Canna indica TaxID=4628 RepID=A0AAQ3QLV4_9LILI|nr:putative WRKY transcription factor 2 isoform X2 [Canna indica]